MGHGIAQVFAAKGMTVTIQDPDGTALGSVKQRVKGICEQLGDDVNCIEHISTYTKLEHAVADADFVIEAAPEKSQLKQGIFKTLVQVCAPDTLLATNSSVIPVGTITSEIDDTNAARIIGIHFWNPPYLIPLVEVIQGERSDEKVIFKVMELLEAVGKTPVHVKKDVVIGNRFQHALWREAMAAVDQGICSAETVDTIIKNTIGLRLEVLGPLENADLVGLDLSHDIHQVVLPQLDTSPEPLPILKQKVEAGDIGMSVNKGFYDWTEEKSAAVRNQLVHHLMKRLRKGA